MPGTGTTRRGGRTAESGNAAQKTLRILEAASAGGGSQRLADIASAAGVPKPSTHRVLGILVGEGFLVAEPGGLYGPGPRLRALAAQVPAPSAGEPAEVVRALQRVVGQTVHLAVRSGDRATYIDKVDADQPYQMASRVGMRVPLHCTAIGKCLLAHQSRADIEAVVDRVGLPRRTANTITTRRALHAELATVRGQGYALDDEENEPTVRCLGVPVLTPAGEVVAAVSVSTITFLVNSGQLLGLLPAVRDAGRALAGLLAATP